MAQISISRVSQYSNKLRKIKIVLNDQVVDHISDGETKVLNVRAGKHRLMAKIDWCQSNILELDLLEDESKDITLKGTNPFLILYFITFGKNSYLSLEA